MLQWIVAHRAHTCMCVCVCTGERQWVLWWAQWQMQARESFHNTDIYYFLACNLIKIRFLWIVFVVHFGQKLDMDTLQECDRICGEYFYYEHIKCAQIASWGKVVIFGLRSVCDNRGVASVQHAQSISHSRTHSRVACVLNPPEPAVACTLHLNCVCIRSNCTHVVCSRKVPFRSMATMVSMVKIWRLIRSPGLYTYSH